MSTTSRQDRTNASVAIAYIESLTTRFENAERHINDDIEQIEKRLQQLVELMKTVSTIQQQVATHQETLSDVRIAVRANLEQLDELMEGFDSKYVNHFALVSRKIADVVGEQTATHKKLNERIGALEENLQKWNNRGIGMWAVFVLVIGLFQYIGMQYVSSIKTEKEVLQATVVKMTARLSDLEMRQQVIERTHQNEEYLP